MSLRLIAKTHISKHVDYSFTGKITCHYFTTKNDICILCPPKKKWKFENYLCTLANNNNNVHKDTIEHNLRISHIILRIPRAEIKATK
jgi:hypothetical protein